MQFILRKFIIEFAKNQQLSKQDANKNNKLL